MNALGCTGQVTYNISPRRYIHTSDAENYRYIAETFEGLKAIEQAAIDTGEALRNILNQLGGGA